ncbi:hypothetical protein EVAR_64320_1 [Eumeta japonica]|uniref:Uncharacterized protein n=1 Tax=Eumeta variegata TaxID=151549 RepID=A0A4C2A6X9_EUMVA|nr:hypothetical protein EVAR_64320_1 [Eumeta japonica]
MYTSQYFRPKIFSMAVLQFREANEHASYQKWSPHSQPRRSHRSVVGFLGRNRVSDGGGTERWRRSGAREREWSTEALTYETKQTSRSCYFMAVFSKSVVSIRSNRPIFVRAGKLTAALPYHVYIVEL